MPRYLVYVNNGLEPPWYQESLVPNGYNTLAEAIGAGKRFTTSNAFRIHEVSQVDEGRDLWVYKDVWPLNTWYLGEWKVRQAGE